MRARASPLTAPSAPDAKAGVAVSTPIPMTLRNGLIVALLVVILDQVTKLGILEWVMDPPRVVPLTGFSALVLVWNRGMSFGMLNTDSELVPWLLGVLTLSVVAGLLWWLKHARRGVVMLGLGLIIGGAAGNLIDRLLYGAVVDFLLLHAGRWQWPAFNVADSAITVGVVLLLWDSLFGPKESRK